jgi:alkanesulfonate monooxygenase SsuD/methylene tetrahydromethanopterin reductase-like flavin-dependent oxidoreductase (luciferase family)
MMDRYWEAHDLILKALSTHDGPFSWEGEYFHYKNVNVWPRAYQAPYPPQWIPASGAYSGKIVAQRDFVAATFLGGHNARVLYDAYREEYLRHHGRPAVRDRLAYMGLVAVGRTEEEGLHRAELISQYIKTSPIVAPQFTNPPGYATVPDNVKVLKAAKSGLVGNFGQVLTKDGTRVAPAKASTQQLIDAGAVFAGTPDQVYEQITSFDRSVGGFGHLLMMAQGGWLSHEDACDNLTLFAEKVYPRLRELSENEKVRMAV